jgi:HK97 family phage major capsid protein
MTMTPEMLREKRSQLVAACEQYAETATPDAVKAFDAAEEEIRAIDGQLSSLSVRSRLDAVKAQGSLVVRPDRRGSAPMTEFHKHLQRRDGTPYELDIRTTLTVGTPATAGNFTVTQQTGEFIKNLDFNNVIRQNATVQSFPTNLDIPVINGRTTVTATAESAAYTESNFTTTKKSFVAHKATAYTDVTEELLNDSVVDVAAEVVADHARAHGRYREGKYATGVGGTTEEDGIFIETAWNSTNRVYTNGPGTRPSFDDCITLYSTLAPGYLSSAVWIMAAGTWGDLLKTKASTAGSYLYDGMSGTMIQDGSVGQLLGRPVYISEFAPVFSGSVERVMVFFGDLRRGYRIVDRQQAAFRVNPYIRSLNGEVRFESVFRSDAHILDTKAGGVIIAGSV